MSSSESASAGGAGAPKSPKGTKEEVPDYSHKLIDGKAISAAVREEIRLDVVSQQLKPGLAVVLVGSRPDSATYVRNKTKSAIECGFKVEDYKFPESATQDAVLECINQLNQDPTFHGILVQLPLPAHMDELTVLKAIDIEKDVDGFSAYNLGSVAMKGGDPFAISCTPKGCMEMLKRSGVELKGKKVVILGRSNIVGLPLALLMIKANATVTVCHSGTKNIPEECLKADVICAAIGKPLFVKAEWVKEGAVIIDVGINSVDAPETKKGYRLVGDVDFPEVVKKASKITPVPGGVGPMTIAMLLKNTLELAQRFKLAQRDGGDDDDEDDK